MPTSSEGLSVNKLNQRGVIAQALVLLLLLAGIGAGIYLVQHPQILRPKAGGEKINWVVSGQDPNNCVTYQNGATVTTCPKVKFQINVPTEVTQ